MSKFIQPIILCGGSGTRLWPLSRTSTPKQLVPIFEGKSLLEMTLNRVGGRRARLFFERKGISVAEKPICIGSYEHLHQIRDITERLEIPITLILETVQKNTAFAMAVGARAAEKVGKNPIVVFCPSDHFIKDESAYLESLLRGFREIDDSSIFTLGVKPTFPNTAYGYIEVTSTDNKSTPFKVKSFIEKPTLEIAKKLWSNPKIFWNAGSFMCRSSGLLNSLHSFEPEIVCCAKNSMDCSQQKDGVYILEKKYVNSCPDKSIDHALMEKYNDLRLIPLASDWSDVGSWNAVSDLFPADKEGNRSNDLRNSFFKSKSTFVYSSDRLVIGVGVHNLAIVETSDVVMVMNIDYAEDIKTVVASLDEVNLPQLKHHRKVARPWGEYDVIDSSTASKVKRIVVKPGGKLSLQKHHKRAEHWIVVKGKGRVTKNSEVFELVENQSTYIPMGVIHRLENPHNEPLEIIEVQTGSYFGEDDICRYEDEYGRNEP